MVILAELRPISVNRKGIVSVYHGDTKRLKKACIRILNVIDRMEGYNEEGILAETRR
jgi:hypothetical protein